MYIYHNISIYLRKILFGKINPCPNKFYLYSIDIACYVWEAESFSLEEKNSSVYVPNAIFMK